MSIPDDDFYVPTEKELLRKDIRDLTAAINRLTDVISALSAQPPDPDPDP